MTLLEKIKLEHPEDINEHSRPMYCPSRYGYADNPEYCGNLSIPVNKRCNDCFNREIPENHNGEVGECHFDPGPKILDSGNRRQFETGAVRDIQEGKGRCDLLPLDVVAGYYNEFFGENDAAFGIFHYLSEFVTTGNAISLYHVLNINEPFGDPASNMFLEVAKHFEEGAKKYGENNWQKGIPVRCYIDSAVRHYLKFLRGDKDEPHDRAFCWNIMCAIWTCKHKPELNEYGKDE